ncbi:hypothetical protein EBR77_00815 [bacterium]|nr:hypothetical protein [bacterium]NBX78653.1 hypothetical protein [bacterium]
MYKQNLLVTLLACAPCMVLAEEKTKTEKQENAQTWFEEVQDTVQKYQTEIIIIGTGIIATVAVITYILINQKEISVQTPTTPVSETTVKPTVPSLPVEESQLTPEITIQEVPATASTIHTTPTEAETLIEPVQNTFVASEEKTKVQEILNNITGIAKLIAQNAKNSANSAKEHIKNAWEHFKTMVEEAKK